nr:pyridoxamine 5'-phosphate oxidase family protein [Allomuricauda sp.]
MIQTIFEELTSELRLGASKKGHPFRFFTLATNGLQSNIGLRTVVLRRVSPEFHLTFYTDSRSTKMKELSYNPSASALFYHPKKLLQLKIEGKAHNVTDKLLIENHWKNVPSNSRRDYTVFKSPGSTLETRMDMEYLTDNNYFSIVNIIPEKIEYLKLGKPDHVRAQFSRTEKDWAGTFLVP